MDQYVNNRQNELLYNLMANPANNGQAYLNNLQQLVKSFPQSGFLQALMAHANGAQNLHQAAAYFDNGALHKLINEPSSFPVVDAAQIFKQESTIALKDYPAGRTVLEAPETTVADKEPEQNLDNRDGFAEDIPLEEAAEIAYINSLRAEEEALVDEDGLPAEEANIEKSHTATEEAEPEDNEEDSQPEGNVIEEDTYDEIAEHGIVDTVRTGEDTETDQADTEDAEFIFASVTSEIDDEVYEEIVGIEDITINHASHLTGNDSFIFGSQLSAGETEYPENEGILTENEDQAANPYTFAENKLNLNDEADKLIVGNIAATDYFMFDRAFARAEDAEKDVVSETAGTENEAAVEEKEDVSLYNDEKMPYTFLWWLDKTRREHAGVYQPYVSFTPQTSTVANTSVDALQMQYFENIFHLTSVEELDKHTAPNGESEVKHKGDEVVERFIKEEPQIRPPSSEKLDTENKAKKSAEDQNDLVTETLANIYADQMLYHKAIAIYKKLMLKFPEKSRYFADRIENLEKKTN